MRVIPPKRGGPTGFFLIDYRVVPARGIINYFFGINSVMTGLHKGAGYIYLGLIDALVASGVMVKELMPFETVL